jgi:putative ABC transport system permease protein
MSLWRQLTGGLRVLLRRAAADADLAAELSAFEQHAADDALARGLSLEAARRTARLETGTFAATRDEVRAAGWEDMVASTAADVRYAARRLRRDLGFTALAASTLALGIGASTAIFSAVNPILFQPLPYPDARRVAMISDYGVDGARIAVTFGSYRELLERSRVLEAAAAMKPWQPTITGEGEPERLDGQRVSAGYFRSLGVLPALGRDFTDEDDRAGGPNVVILSDGLWRRRFGADGTIVGRDIRLSDNLYSVIGVMPRGFENVLAPTAEAWAPLQYDASLPQQGREWGHHLRMVARLRPGIDPAAAKRDLDAIARTPVAEFNRVPWASMGRGLVVDRLQDEITRAVKPALLAVAGAVALVLVIACVNVTNLLLARAARRRTEFAMRAALGAGRGRIIRQLLTESLILALVGGVLGLGVAGLGVRAIIAVSPSELPRVGAIHVDAIALVFGLATTTLVGVFFGLLPALHASRDLHASMQRGSSRSTGGRHATRRALVVAEVALALILVVGAGLLLRSLRQLLVVAPGFDPSGVLTMQVQAAGHQFDVGDATQRFFDRALDAVRRVPGVAAAGFTSQLPLSGDFDKYGVVIESIPIDPNQDGSVLRYAISPGYVEAMRIPLRRGRSIEAADAAGRPVAVLINESMANSRFPGRDAIGQHLHLGRTDLPWYTVVGVVADVRQTSLAVSATNAVYVPLTQWYAPDRVRSLVVRTQGDAAALAPAIKRAIWSVDRDQAIVRVATMDQLAAATAAERRFVLILFEAFGGAALLLAAIGLYGIVAGTVTERTREIGVRSALGASRSEIVTLVLQQGMTLTCAGVAIGVGVALAASRALVTLLFGVSPTDSTTYVSVVALLFTVSAAACSVPAWRAARIDPSITLRDD